MPEIIFIFRVEFVRSRLLRNSVLANTIIGIIPTDPDKPFKDLDSIRGQKTVGSVVTVVQVIFYENCYYCFGLMIRVTRLGDIV